jgi:hypothetical protein
MPVELAEACVAFGRALATLGDAAGARVELERAWVIFTRIGATARANAV